MGPRTRGAHEGAHFPLNIKKCLIEKKNPLLGHINNQFNTCFNQSKALKNEYRIGTFLLSSLTFECQKHPINHYIQDAVLLPTTDHSRPEHALKIVQIFKMAARNLTTLLHQIIKTKTGTQCRVNIHFSSLSVMLLWK